MSRTYLVHLPRAEARHLAGIGRGGPVSAEAACVEAVREWLQEVRAAGHRLFPVSRITGELGAIVGRVPVEPRPARGPFAPGRGGLTLPGRIEYLGSGIVRLDEAAISSLAGLSDGEDFRVVFAGCGPVLTVGPDRYPAEEEDPGRNG